MFGDIIDHVGIYGSRLAEGLSASNVGLVDFPLKKQGFNIANQKTLLLIHNVIKIMSDIYLENITVRLPYT